jgi:glutathione S-transferase
MKLYYSTGSPYARKVRIVLAEKGLDYEADLDDRVRPIEEAPGPTLSVPLLEDGDLRIWESDVIVDYLLQTYPSDLASTENPPLSPWLARPDRHWQDMTTLATIGTCANSMINIRLMLVDGITPENSDYLARQRSRVDRCLDWLEARITEEGFAPGWFSIMDIAFICPMGYCEARGIMPWRGRPKLEALYDRYQDRASVQATPVNQLPPIQPRYSVTRAPRAMTSS